MSAGDSEFAIVIIIIVVVFVSHSSPHSDLIVRLQVKVVEKHLKKLSRVKKRLQLS